MPHTNPSSPDSPVPSEQSSDRREQLFLLVYPDRTVQDQAGNEVRLPETVALNREAVLKAIGVSSTMWDRYDVHLDNAA